MAPAVDPGSVLVSKHARVYVDDHVFNLGEVAGTSPQALCDALADRLEELADTLRGPLTKPAPACEGCGSEMVYRRGWPGRYTVEARDDDGEPSIFGVHYVSTCVMDAEHARRLAETGE